MAVIAVTLTHAVVEVLLVDVFYAVHAEMVQARQVSEESERVVVESEW
jgi:hypothetical protein